MDADDCHHYLVLLQRTSHRIAWGLLILNLILGCIHAYEGLMEVKFRLDAVRTEGRIDQVYPGPEWLVAFTVNGDLFTARTSRLAGSPRAGDRVVVMTDPADPTVAVSPGMSLQDWSELPGLLALHAGLVLGPILILWFVRIEDREAPERPILRPRGSTVRRRRRARR
jgi:hypothetical protein